MSLIILAGVVAAVIIIVFLCALWSGMGNPVVKFLYLIVNVFVLVLVIRFRDLIPPLYLLFRFSGIQMDQGTLTEKGLERRNADFDPLLQHKFHLICLGHGLEQGDFSGWFCIRGLGGFYLGHHPIFPGSDLQNDTGIVHPPPVTNR